MSKASDKVKKKKRKQQGIERQRLKNLSDHVVSIRNKKEVLISAKNPKSKFIKFIGSVYFKITVIITIVSIPTYFFWFKDKVHELITPSSKLFEEENFIKGIFIPDRVLETDKDLSVFYGSVGITYPIGKYKQGVDVTPSLIGCEGQPLSDIKLKIINNRLYVSIEINDLESGEIVGIIDYNHWSLYKKNVLRYHDEDNYLEVIDKYNNVVFSIFFFNSHTIRIQGYFLRRGAITVVSDGVTCLGDSDKKEAMQAIKRIKKIYPY